MITSETIFVQLLLISGHRLALAVLPILAELTITFESSMSGVCFVNSGDVTYALMLHSRKIFDEHVVK